MLLEELLIDSGATAIIVYLILDLRRRMDRVERILNGKGA